MYLASVCPTRTRRLQVDERGHSVITALLLSLLGLGLFGAILMALEPTVQLASLRVGDCIQAALGGQGTCGAGERTQQPTLNASNAPGARSSAVQAGGPSALPAFPRPSPSAQGQGPFAWTAAPKETAGVPDPLAFVRQTVQSAPNPASPSLPQAVQAGRQAATRANALENGGTPPGSNPLSPAQGGGGGPGQGNQGDHTSPPRPPGFPLAPWEQEGVTYEDFALANVPKFALPQPTDTFNQATATLIKDRDGQPIAVRVTRTSSKESFKGEADVDYWTVVGSGSGNLEWGIGREASERRFTTGGGERVLPVLNEVEYYPNVPPHVAPAVGNDISILRENEATLALWYEPMKAKDGSTSLVSRLTLRGAEHTALDRSGATVRSVAVSSSDGEVLSRAEAGQREWVRLPEGADGHADHQQVSVGTRERLPFGWDDTAIDFHRTRDRDTGAWSQWQLDSSASSVYLQAVPTTRISDPDGSTRLVFGTRSPTIRAFDPSDRLVTVEDGSYTATYVYPSETATGSPLERLSGYVPMPAQTTGVANMEAEPAADMRANMALYRRLDESGCAPPGCAPRYQVQYAPAEWRTVPSVVIGPLLVAKAIEERVRGGAAPEWSNARIRDVAQLITNFQAKRAEPEAERLLEKYEAKVKELASRKE